MHSASHPLRALCNSLERCIFVDQQGRRFVREDDRRDILRDTILSLPSRFGFVIVDHDGFESNPPSFRRELHEGLERQEVYRPRRSRRWRSC